MGKKIKKPLDMSGSKLQRLARHDVMEQVSSKARNVDLVRVSDGKVMRDNETLAEAGIESGTHFVTRPRIEVLPPELRGLHPADGVNQLSSIDSMPADIAEELIEDMPRFSSTKVAGLWAKAADDAEAKGDKQSAFNAGRLGRAELLMPGWTKIAMPLCDVHRPGDGFVRWVADAGVSSLTTLLWLRATVARIAKEGFATPNRQFNHDPKVIAESHRLFVAAFEDSRFLAYDDDAIAVTANRIDEAVHEAAGLDLKYDAADGRSDEDMKKDSETEEHRRWFRVAEHNMPASMPMPFPKVTLVFGTGATLTQAEARRFAWEWDPKQRQMGIAIAVTLDETRGDAWRVAVVEEPNKSPGLHITRVRENGTWTYSARHGLLPHALWVLLTSAREFKGSAAPGVTTAQRTASEIAHGRRQTPPPFYVVRQRLSPPTVNTPPAEPVHHASPSFRFDVRSHDRVFVHRGPVPLEPAIEKRLLRRGYRIFTERWPDGLADACRARGHEDPKPGEWIAVRVVKVKSHLKGPATAEYVPSLRVPSSTRGKDNGAILDKEEQSTGAD